MHIVLTICSALLAAATVFFAVRAAQYSARCDFQARRLSAAMGRLTGLEGTADSLTTQVQKLRGQFHAYKAANAPPYECVVDRAPERSEINQDFFCENYAQAQVSGPSSEFASCQCTYCMAMRARREASRQALVPKTAQGQATLARISAGKSHE